MAWWWETLMKLVISKPGAHDDAEHWYQTEDLAAPGCRKHPQTMHIPLAYWTELSFGWGSAIAKAWGEGIVPWIVLGQERTHVYSYSLQRKSHKADREVLAQHTMLVSLSSPLRQSNRNGSFPGLHQTLTKIRGSWLVWWVLPSLTIFEELEDWCPGDWRALSPDSTCFKWVEISAIPPFPTKPRNCWASTVQCSDLG